MSEVAALFEASRSKSWPTVEGTVTKPRIDRSRTTKGSTIESPVVRYRYEVDGKGYHRGKLSLSDGVTTSRFESASSVVARYVVGNLVKVYYDRQHPENAVLEPGTTRENMGVALAGCPVLVRDRRLRDVRPARNERRIRAVTEDQCRSHLARRASE